MSREARIALGVGAAVAVALVAVAVLVVLYARGGGPVPGALSALSPAPAGDSLASSDARESVLRTLRLAGIERGVVGDADGVAVVRLEVPEVSGPADVELAWVTGAGALAGSYPDASRYVVQVYAAAPGAASAVPTAAPMPLLEVAWDGAGAREAVEADDPAALRKAAKFRVISREGAQ